MIAPVGADDHIGPLDTVFFCGPMWSSAPTSKIYKHLEKSEFNSQFSILNSPGGAPWNGSSGISVALLN